jgi:hypothetical protein
MPVRGFGLRLAETWRGERATYLGLFVCFVVNPRSPVNDGGFE